MKTALIIEDCLETAQWTMTLLHQVFPNIKISHCLNCQTTKEHLNTASPNIVLIDINLPDGSGLTLIHTTLRASPQAIVIMMTIVDDKESIFKAIQQGASGYLLKGLSKGVFLHKLNGILMGDPPLSPSIAQKILQYVRDQEMPVISIKTTALKTQDHYSICHDDVMELTNRETEVLGYLGKGYSRKEVAGRLSISENTIATHIRHIYHKLDISNRAEAAVKAHHMGLLTM